MLSFSTYYRKYQNFLSVFPKDEILVLTNAELAGNAQATMRKTFNFLGLEPFESQEFEELRYSTGSNLDVLSSEISKN